MAITIRNKETEELIRKIGRRTGEGPSAVIRRLAHNDIVKAERPVPEAEVQRRLARFEELRKKFPPPENPPSREEIEEEMDSIFGEDLQ